jgi:hypothetical protein
MNNPELNKKKLKILRGELLTEKASSFWQDEDKDERKMNIDKQDETLGVDDSEDEEEGMGM